MIKNRNLCQVLSIADACFFHLIRRLPVGNEEADTSCGKSQRKNYNQTGMSSNLIEDVIPSKSPACSDFCHRIVANEPLALY